MHDSYIVASIPAPLRVSSSGGGAGGKLPPRMLSFPPKRKGKIGGREGGEREEKRGGGRERGVLYPTLSRHSPLPLHVADDWSSPSLTTNLSICFCIIISTCA